jgi:hypothetical protein
VIIISNPLLADMATSSWYLEWISSEVSVDFPARAHCGQGRVPSPLLSFQVPPCATAATAACSASTLSCTPSTTPTHEPPTATTNTLAAEGPLYVYWPSRKHLKIHGLRQGRPVWPSPQSPGSTLQGPALLCRPAPQARLLLPQGPGRPQGDGGRAGQGEARLPPHWGQLPLEKPIRNVLLQVRPGPTRLAIALAAPLATCRPGGSPVLLLRAGRRAGGGRLAGRAARGAPGCPHTSSPGPAAPPPPPGRPAPTHRPHGSQPAYDQPGAAKAKAKPTARVPGEEPVSGPHDRAHTSLLPSCPQTADRRGCGAIALGRRGKLWKIRRGLHKGLERRR